ncbi:hypothetical protein MKX03_006916 [Papaver bracteatum]|nr:hypothetical protein MKX03_006916 [Papaver bracteatum]
MYKKTIRFPYSTTFVNPLFEKHRKQFGIGGALPPKKDLHRFVKWPKVVHIQRKRRISKQRLKVPPALNQFIETLDNNLEGKTVEAKKPILVKYRLNHITYLIEQNKSQMVIIAHDVDPIDLVDLVVCLPALCRKMLIQYAIIKGKVRLGAIVHKKTALALCLTSVKNEDKMESNKIVEADKFDEHRKKWGGGSKSQARFFKLLVQLVDLCLLVRMNNNLSFLDIFLIFAL